MTFGMDGVESAKAAQTDIAWKHMEMRAIQSRSAAYAFPPWFDAREGLAHNPAKTDERKTHGNFKEGIRIQGRWQRSRR
jgi:hypothetical protein